MSDVKVTIGGDATPLAQAFSNAKSIAKHGGEVVGVEFGNAMAYRAENRMRRGIDSAIKSISSASDPISALGGVVEGIAGSFRIASASFLAFAVGDFLREQLTEAAEAATEFYEKTDAIFEVTKSSGKEFAESAVKAFQAAEKSYEKEGFIARLIYGSGQRKTLEAGKKAAESAMEGLREIREKGYKAASELLSPDLKVQQQGEIDSANLEYDEKVAAAKTAGDSIVDIEEARHQKINRIVKEFIKKDEEQSKPAAEAAKAAGEKEIATARALAEEKEKQKHLDEEAGAVTSSQKVEAIKKEIAANKELQNGWMTQLERERLITAEKELQNKLTTEESRLAEKKDAAGLELQRNTEEQRDARQEVNARAADALGFHGQVDSLRRQGFAGRAGPNQNSEQLKALGEANKRLDMLIVQGDELNKKVDSI